MGKLQSITLEPRELDSLEEIVNLDTGRLRTQYLRKTLDQLFVRPGEKHAVLSGVYAFFWTGGADMIDGERLTANYQGKAIKGSKDVDGESRFVDHALKWQFTSPDCQCLYVGKTQDFPTRLGLHIKAGTRSEYWYSSDKGQLALENNRLHKPTTSCQLRSGMEHLFPDKNTDTLALIKSHVRYFFEPSIFPEYRFYREYELVSDHKPWFNLDVER